MKSYVFKAVVEDDEFEDGRQAFHAYCPAIQGARTWGFTREEALDNLRTVVKMAIEGMIEDGKPIPRDSFILEVESPAVLVTV